MIYSWIVIKMMVIAGKSKQGKMKKKVGEKMYTCSYCPWQGVDNWCLKVRCDN